MEDEVDAVRALVAPIKAYCLATPAAGSSVSSRYVRQMLYKIIGSQRKPLLGEGKPDLRAIYPHLSCGFCKGPAGSITTAGSIDPVTLPCGHLVCRSCILGKLFSLDEDGPKTHSECPECHARYPKAVIDSRQPTRIVAKINGYLLGAEGGGGAVAADPASTIPPSVQAAQAALMARFADIKGYGRLKSDAANAAIRDELNSLLRSQVPLSDKDGAIYKEGLECGVCFSMLGLGARADGSVPAVPDPVTLPCGHSYCRACIRPVVGGGSQICPECRAPCLVNAATPLVSVGLSGLVSDLNPRVGEVVVAAAPAVAVAAGGAGASSEDPAAVGGRRRHKKRTQKMQKTRTRSRSKRTRSSRRR